MKKIILLKTMFCMSFLTMQLQAQLPTVQDCPCAIPICQNIYNEVNSYVGTGSLPQEINSVISCLGQGEKNSVWYTFTVQSSGSLNFSITPNVLMDDYDWAVYNLTNNNCSDIFSNPSLEAACNYAGAPGVTGPNGLPGAQNEPPIPVLVGQTYVICVSQFTSSPNGYSINFSASTASIIDITPPTIDSVNTNFVCGQDSFLVTFSENIQCSSVQPSDFELRDPSLTLMTIDSVVAVNCNSICGYSRTFIFYFSPPVNILGTYNLQIVNTIDDICGNSCLIPTIINFNVSAYTYANTSVNVACPGGTNGSINVVVTSPGVYSYLWSGSQTTANVTGLGPGTYTVTVTKGGGCPDLITFTITAPAAFTYTTASTNAGCGQSNGTASINVTGGGTGPYTYNWSTGATTSTAPNVANGTYTVTVTDFKGCTFTATVAVNATAGVTATIPTSVNVKCFNAATGSANSAANNGSGTYTYLWSNGQTLANASTLAAGTYTVTITDVNGGCTATATVVITQPATAVSGISTTAATKCNLANGLAYVTAAGGLGPYTYVWSNGVSNDSISLVAAATYTVTITDANNCTVTVTASVAASLAVTGTVPAQVNVSCNGGSNGTGTAGCNNCTGAISYAWSNGQTTQTAIGLAAGTFTVTVTDANGCTGTGAVTITQPTALSIINAINDTVCLTQISSITPNGSGGTGPYTFLWNNGNTNALLAVSPGGTTTYTVTVTDNKLCTKTASVTVYVRPALTVSTNNDTTICSGSQVSISATSGGGSGTYTYNWNNGLNALQNFNITPVSDTTLLIQLTDNCGSPAVYDTVHIYVSTPMVISFPVVNNVKCNGGNTGDATASVLNGITPYSYLWSNGQTTINATGLSAGTYTITVTDNQNCTMSATVSITQPAALVISSLPGDTICQTKNGALLPVVAGGTVAYSYLWSNGNTNSSLIISPGSTTSFTVTVTDANNCTTTASAQIWVLPALSIVASNDTTICFGASATISAQGSGGDNIYTYTWNGNVGGTSQLVSPTQDTTLVIMLSDVCGSPVVYDTVKITVIPEIVASTISIVNVSCFNGSNGSAQVSHIGGLAPFSFLWSNGQTTTTATGLAAGTYTVTVTDSKGCTGTATAIITQPPALTIAGLPNVTICLSNTTTLAPVYGGGTPAYTYSWSNGATAGSITVGPASTTTYTVTVTDSKGCTLTQSVTVIVNPALTLIASNDSTICFGSTIMLNAAASGGNGNYTISWNNGLATGSSVTMTLFGDTTLAIELTDNCGTPAQYDTIKVTVVPEIKASSIVNQNVSCFGGNDGSSTVTQTGGFAPFSYQWSNGATTATNANCSAGTYTITVTDSKGCTGTTTVTITEPPQLTIAPITGATICIGESSLIAPTYGGGTPGYQYLWSNGATTATINVSPTVTNSYTVTVTDTKNCTTTAVALITVRPPLSFTFVTPNTTICKGKTLTVTATVKGGDGNYQYSFNGGAFGAANSLTFLVTQDTIIYIVVKDSCTTPQITDTIEVISIDAPIVNFSWDPSAGCQPLTVIFKDSTKAVANSTYLWKFGDGNTSTLVNPVHVYKNYGIYDVSLTVTTPQGCETSLLKPQIIEVYERPVALFEWSPKDPSLFYPMVYFYDQSSGNPTQWTWTFGDSSLFSFEQNPNHQYEDTGKYVVTLLVSNQYGCTDSIEFIIEVKDNFTFYIPNTFTPNGDGKNDYFAVLGINYERFTTRILNRWGQPVFETNAPNFWDGNDFNGKESPQGTYVYVIEVFEKTGKKHTYRGNINLVR